MDGQLNTLIAKRGKLKGHLTRFEKFLDNMDNSPAQLAELQKRTQKIDTLWDHFNDIQTEIQMLDNETDHELETEEFENKYFKLTSIAETKLKQSPNKTVVETNASKSNATTNIKLPDIDLPVFTGNDEGWLSFRDSFKSLIHENPHLSATEKFYYLRSAVKDEAAQCIKNLETSDEHYSVAWGLLTERYENKKIIIHSHLKNIFDLPNVIKESYVSLRQFLDTFKQHYRALIHLGEPVESWNTILIFLLTSKLDFSTRREWEISTKNEISPSIDEFVKVLHSKCLLLKTINSKVITGSTANQTISNKYKSKSDQKLLCHATSTQTCVFCSEQHYIFVCDKFLALSPNERFTQAKGLNLCINCLKSGHSSSVCNKGVCKKCSKPHNTLLHFDLNQKPSNAKNDNSNSRQQAKIEDPNTRNTSASFIQSSSQDNIPSVNSTLSHFTQKNNYVLLSTALVYILDKSGKHIKCRALLDSGSQSNFITESLYEKLNLTSTKLNMSVSGINQISSVISRQLRCTIKSTRNEFTRELNFLVINSITENIPHTSIDGESLQIPSDMQLADPEFYISSQIDVLLGANIFWDLLKVGKIRLNNHSPMLQNTVLGWIVSGTIPQKSRLSTICNFATTTNNISNAQLNEQLEKFWLVENSHNLPQSKYTEEEINCESHFLDNFYRNKDGRFVVSLPFKENCELGESKQHATKNFYGLERRLQKNPYLYEQYRLFMNEYISLNHMKEITEIENDYGYYLPHHSVLKQDSLTTKVRVVFNASAKTTNNLSLNDVLMVGPCIQNSLFSILTRFRTHNIVLVADIAKMYRQILVSENDRKFQRILWRDSPGDELKHYELQTITYGTAPASFLATRCLKQIAIENKSNFFQVYDTVINDFYMDDLLTGSHDISTAIQLKDELEQVLSSAGFTLRKWISNIPDVIQNSHNSANDANYIISDDDNVKVLGMSWNSTTDCFYYSFNDDRHHDSKIAITKRFILSMMARIYDPLGLISCVIIIAKCMLQTLWKNNINWDERLPKEFENSWIKFLDQLPMLNKLKIPRQITVHNVTNIQLHGYCDASEKAYGACLYLRTIDDSGCISVRLICAKSRVAPVKSLTLPKLELCGALLLSRLAVGTIKDLNLDFQNIWFWCDSLIVLSWLAAHSSTWKTFVCNRVAEIQRLTSKEQWRHVPSAQNPADIISRGCFPIDLLEKNLWWHGPSYLSQQESFWPRNISTKSHDIPEIKNKNPITLLVESSFNIFDRFSTFSKLQRVTAYILRFVNRLKSKNEQHFPINLTTHELNTATLKLAKLAQKEEFSSEIESILRDKSVAKKSKLACLNPFLDQDEIIRVGGRLVHSKLPSEQKFPIVLPEKHPLTQLLIKHQHLKNLHSGPQLTLSCLRNQFWPLNGKQAVRSELRKCMICFRADPPSICPQMGNLPSYRVNPSPIFYSVGTDFAGPFLVKDGKLRNRKLIKSYFCVFICLSTKAVHLEPVGDLSTEVFLNAFKRFVGRRGFCKHVYSDNATNYVGASNTFQRIHQLTKDKSFQSFLDENTIEWHFIPSKSPHFGGIWESAVRSVKHHIKRVANNVHFTYEEFHTLLTQIESILNSRPLTPLSHDPSDLEALTPGHFLIGRSMTALPQENMQNQACSRLNRFQHLQQIVQHFWRRWNQEYLHTLQARTKWKFNSPQETLVGSLVLLKEDNLPPQRWRLGRILQLFPGSDSVVRVVLVKTSSGVVKRAVTRICVLPIE